MQDFATAVKAHLKTVSDKDIAAFSKYLHPDYEPIIIMPKGAIVQGYQDALDLHKEWFDDPDWSMEVAVLDVFCVGNIGYALVDVVYHDLDLDKVHYMMNYYLSLVFIYVSDLDRWILLRDQNTLK